MAWTGSERITDRRTFLARMALAAVGAAGSATLASCSSPSIGDANVVTLGSAAPDAPVNRALARLSTRFERETRNVVIVNQAPFQPFRDNLIAYLTSAPDDLLTVSAGERIDFAVKNKLLGRMSGQVRESRAGSSASAYFLPLTVTPRVYFYRRSVWQKHGWVPPQTLAELTALVSSMRGSGMTPIAFAAADASSAIATFDTLDIAVNGYGFHDRLLSGRASWRSGSVDRTLAAWRAIRPFQDAHARQRDQTAALERLTSKRAAMFLCGSEVVAQLQQRADFGDFDFFSPPGLAADGGTVEGASDGIALSERGAHQRAAQALVEVIADPASWAPLRSQLPDIVLLRGGAASSTDRSITGRLTVLANSASRISQPLDRALSPAAQAIVAPALQAFATGAGFDGTAVEAAVAAQRG